MSFSKIASLAATVASMASVASAHGHVQGIVVDGEYYTGYSPSFQYEATQPVVIAWSTPEDLSNGYIDPDNYTTSEIICHLGATPGQAAAPVKAGGTVELQWTTWPDSHHGPVLDYLANCNGPCETVEKTDLEFFKIDQGGLIDDSSVPGTWASDQLIANNNSWTVTIPEDIAPGNYVLRHEIIALHSAGDSDGAQNYPQCINLIVEGSGTATPSGVSGEKLYSPTDAGILVNIYQSLSTYDIPGPTLYSGAITMSQTSQAAATANGVPQSVYSGGSVAAATTAATSAAAATTVAASSATPTAAVSSSAVSSAASSVITSAAVSSASATFIQQATSVNAVSAVVASPSAAATPAASSTSESVSAMPSGTTLYDVVGWLGEYMNQMLSSSSSSSKAKRSGAKVHARDFRV